MEPLAHRLGPQMTVQMTAGLREVLAQTVLLNVDVLGISDRSSIRGARAPPRSMHPAP